MLRSGRFLFLSVLVVAFATSACSAKKPKAVDATTADTSTSSADKVGSTPEDMLSNEVGGGDGKDASTDDGKDPFADLTKDDKATDPSADAAKDATTDAPKEDAKDQVAEKTPDDTAAPAPAPEDEKPAANTADAGTAGSSDPFSDLSQQGTGTKSASSGEATDVYKVKSGDTLMKVAFSLYGDISRWKDIQAWNEGKIKNGTLTKGMKLHVEPGDYQPEAHEHSYLIKKGDTLAGIAEDVYGKRSKYRKLQHYNAKLIKNPNVIFAGFSLYYDISAQELAEADARRQQKGGAAPASNAEPAPASMADNTTPSAINPPAEAPAPAGNVATNQGSSAQPMGGSSAPQPAPAGAAAMGPPAPNGK